MDRYLDSLSGGPEFSHRRLWVTLLVATAILAGAALLARSFPNSGYQAGYDAVITQGEKPIRDQVDAAGGRALTICDGLHAKEDSTPDSPRYAYDSFVKGCGDAIDHLYGRHVPLLEPSK